MHILFLALVYLYPPWPRKCSILQFIKTCFYTSFHHNQVVAHSNSRWISCNSLGKAYSCNRSPPAITDHRRRNQCNDLPLRPQNQSYSATSLHTRLASSSQTKLMIITTHVHTLNRNTWEEFQCQCFISPKSWAITLRVGCSGLQTLHRYKMRQLRTTCCNILIFLL